MDSLKSAFLVAMASVKRSAKHHVTGLKHDNRVFLYDRFNPCDEYEQAFLSQKAVKRPCVIRPSRVFFYLAGSLRSFKYNPVQFKNFIIHQPNNGTIEKGSLDTGVSSRRQLIDDMKLTAHNYRKSSDIPANRAFIDQGTADTTIMSSLSEMIASDRQYYDINVNDNVESVKSLSECQLVRRSVKAGGLNRACFSELCSVYGSSVYRLEPLTGAEVPKHENLNWLQSHIGKNGIDALTAADFADCFKVLNLGANEFYKVIFGGVASYKVDQSGNGHEYDFYFLKTRNCLTGGLINCSPGAVSVALKKFQAIANDLKEFESDNFESLPYNDDGFIDGSEDDQTDFESDLDEFEDIESINSGWTAKQLSDGLESLPHHLINKVRFCNYQSYLAINKALHDTSYGCLKSRISSSAFSQLWVYMNDRKEYFNRKKAEAVKVTAKALPLHVYQGIQNFKKEKSKVNKRYLTTCVFGGVWDSVEIKKADKSVASVIWQVIAGKM